MGFSENVPLASLVIFSQLFQRKPKSNSTDRWKSRSPLADGPELDYRTIKPQNPKMPKPPNPKTPSRRTVARARTPRVARWAAFMVCGSFSDRRLPTARRYSARHCDMARPSWGPRLAGGWRRGEGRSQEPTARIEMCSFRTQGLEGGREGKIQSPD